MPIPEPPRPPIKPRERDDPKAEILDGTYGGYYTREELDQLRAWREERLKAVLLNQKEAWEQTPQGKLCLEIYRKFQEYKELLEEDRRLKPPDGMGRVEYPEHELFTLALESAEKLHEHRAEKSRQNLEKARMAARCQHIFLSGERCRAPRVRGRKLCRMHAQVVQAKTLKMDLGPLEDPDSIQLAIQKLLKAIVDGTVEPKTLSYVTNLLQVAAWNVTRTRFGLQAMEEAAGENYEEVSQE